MSKESSPSREVKQPMLTSAGPDLSSWCSLDLGVKEQTFRMSK